MTFQSTPPTNMSMDSFWLASHRDGFPELLAAQGYYKRTIVTYRLMISRICTEAESCNPGPDSFGEEAMVELAGTCPRTGTPYMEQELAMVTRWFTNHLVHVGVIKPTTPPPPVPASPEHICTELDHWLWCHRGIFRGCSGVGCRFT